MTVKNVRIDPNEIKQGVGKAQTGPVTSNFDSFLGAVEAMTPMNTEIMYQATGNSNAAAVLHGAFTGMGGAAGAYGYGSGSGAGYAGASALSEYPGMMGTGSYGTFAGKTMGGGGGKAVGGPAGGDLPTGDLINTMNTSNLKLLELQATMQSNMQKWNTQSNILSADHRARMAMIEKFTTR